MIEVDLISLPSVVVNLTQVGIGGSTVLDCRLENTTSLFTSRLPFALASTVCKACAAMTGTHRRSCRTPLQLPRGPARGRRGTPAADQLRDGDVGNRQLPTLFDAPAMLAQNGHQARAAAYTRPMRRSGKTNPASGMTPARSDVVQVAALLWRLSKAGGARCRVSRHAPRGRQGEHSRRGSSWHT